MVVDRVVDRSRVRQVGVVAALLATIDSVATLLWLRLQVAEEANPLVDALIQQWGEGGGLALRTVYAVLLIGSLTWIAERRPTVRLRGALAVVSGAMAAIVGYHALAATWLTAQLVA